MENWTIFITGMTVGMMIINALNLIKKPDSEMFHELQKRERDRKK